MDHVTTTELSVEQIARRAGFGTATSLRQHLRATIGVAPTAYRRAFAWRWARVSTIASQARW